LEAAPRTIRCPAQIRDVSWIKVDEALREAELELENSQIGQETKKLLRRTLVWAGLKTVN
jgi:hypothetical protein